MELLRRCCCCCCSSSLLLLGFLGLAPDWSSAPRYSELRPLVLEPPGLREAMEAVPERRLSAEELEVLERDGVLLVKGVIPNRTLLEWLASGMWSYGTFFDVLRTQTYTSNGYAMALVRDGPLSPMLVDALGAEAAMLMEAPIFSTAGVVEHHQNAWHVDQGPQSSRFVSAWLALSDAPHGLDFLRGSHRVRRELFLECNRSKDGLERLLDDDCAQTFARQRAEPRAGAASPAWFDLAPGDALVFDGQVAHRGVSWARPRLTIAVRVGAAVGQPPCFRTPGGSYFTAAHPRRPDSFACMRPQWLPRKETAWPELDTSLPREEDCWPGLRWAAGPLQRLAAGATSAAFPARERMPRGR